MVGAIGWYVRVYTREIYAGVYNSVIYVVGVPTPAEAIEAANRLRSDESETFEIIPGEVVECRGPQPEPGEIRYLGVG